MTRALDPLKVPLSGAHLIEAGAGTGKTYTIAALYLRLVLGHGGKNGFGRSLCPPEILVVTFTNAATEELRERIRTRLTEAAAFFRGQGAGDGILKGLRDAAPADDRPGQARLLDRAAQWMDEAAIFTIHGWCQRMLRQHAFDSNSLFDLELTADDRELWEEAACDYWRSRFYPRSRQELAAMLDLVRCKTPLSLLDRVLPLADALPEAPRPPFEVLAQRCQAVERARRCCREDWDAAAALIRSAREDKALNGNKYRAASVEGWLAQMAAWIDGSGPLPEAKALEKLSARGLSEGTSKNRRTPEHPAFDALDALNDALAELDVEGALIRHGAVEIHRRARLEKERRAHMGFDDLITRLGAALEGPGGPGLAAVIRRQFPVALIDEFQDTDPTQYAIFRGVYHGRDGTGLFMIGDPKQAIYAFRGADIHTYLKARRDAAGHRHTLDTNYRSAQGVVVAVNRLFGAARNYPEGPFLFGDQIPLSPAKARGREEQWEVQGRPAAGMTLWRLAQDKPVARHGPEGYLARMAAATATEIVRLLHLARENPTGAGFRKPGEAVVALRPADMAILVRDGVEARAMRLALERRNVRSVYLSDKDSVFATDEARDLLCLLQACAEPERGGPLKSALATATLALSWVQLDRCSADEQVWEAEVERFREMRSIWRHRGVLPMVRALLQAFDVPARLLAEPGGERRLTNLLHLAEILQAAGGALEGEPALIRWLAEQIRRPGGAWDEAVLRLESDAELVRVVTIHKAKGLEYPLVFLPFVCGFRAVTRQNTTVARFHDGDGRPCRVLDPSDNDLLRADRERLAEELRMLYVAVTRARHACWLGIGVLGRTSAKKGETSELHRCALGYLLGGGAVIAAGELEDRLRQCIGDCPSMTLATLPDPDPRAYRPPDEKAALEAARPFAAQVPRGWAITSYSGILAGAALLESNASGPGPESLATAAGDGETAPGAPDSPLEDRLQEVLIEAPAAWEIRSGPLSILRFPRGPGPGTFLHGLLEWAAREGFGRVAGDQALLRKKIDTAGAWFGWQEWTSTLAGWLKNLLQTPLPLPGSTESLPLSGLATGDCQAEMEFLLAAHRVSATGLDAAVTAAILPGAQRPVLQAARVDGMLKGFIDLVFTHGGRYYILDYKSNHLGDDPGAYGPAQMAAAMLAHRYDLQFVLYTLALHRLLKSRLPGYDYTRHMGGAVYLFLRGVDAAGRGVYGQRPPAALIRRLDADFSSGKADHET
jgi:exodeoxyribonuclease V beta subunit